MSRLRVVASTMLLPAVLAAAAMANAQDEDTQPNESAEVELQEFQDREEIQQSIQEILARSEFRRLEFRKPPPKPTFPEWLKRLIEWMRPYFAVLTILLGTLTTAMGILVLVVIAAICLLIIWLIVRALAGMKSLPNERTPQTEFDEGEVILAPGELAGDVYLRRAEKLAADGRFVEAISQLLVGAMGFVERSGLIRFRPGLTHRDYLRATRRKRELHADMRAMVTVFEPLSFGRRPARSEHFQTSLQHYLASFHGT